MRSGIGKVNAAVCTQILADDFQVEAVINTGIAGSLKAEINIGDIVLATDTLQHDMDATEFGYPKGQVPRMETLSFPADERMYQLAAEVCREVNPDIQVFTGRIVSGDQFVASRKVKEAIAAEFQGFCTEMEGAAVGQTAWLNQIPFLIVRAISDLSLIHIFCDAFYDGKSQTVSGTLISYKGGKDSRNPVFWNPLTGIGDRQAEGIF